MISSPMFSNAPPAANARHTIGIARIPAIAEPAHERVDATVERAGLFDDAERASHQEHERDHRCRVDDPIGNRDDRLEGAHRMRVDAVIRAGDDHLPSRCGIVAPVELPRGEHVRERGRDDHAGDEQCQRVRELHLAAFTTPAASSARRYSPTSSRLTGPNSALAMSRISRALRLPFTRFRTS